MAHKEPELEDMSIQLPPGVVVGNILDSALITGEYPTKEKTLSVQTIQIPFSELPAQSILHLHMHMSSNYLYGCCTKNGGLK